MTHGVTGENNPGTDSGIESSETETEIQETAADLTKFQVRILAILAADDRYGLAVKEELSEYYGEEINHGRLYPNLDKLVDQEFVDKSELDKRTNNYALTEKGHTALRHEFEWLEAHLNGGEK
ncbi:PadR family transcriptional regulator [Natrinema sp. DC36]|uniref:PadR family transcriptional regulator n=1 Tax=Natrinema sp. DC36 TaxID=2878680 RepID=UPI001CF09587|nr:PadR family transcriptional regulator [Natrinema sp. DC36]